MTCVSRPPNLFRYRLLATCIVTPLLDWSWLRPPIFQCHPDDAGDDGDDNGGDNEDEDGDDGGCGCGFCDDDGRYDVGVDDVDFDDDDWDDIAHDGADGVDDVGNFDDEA